LSASHLLPPPCLSLLLFLSSTNTIPLCQTLELTTPTPKTGQKSTAAAGAACASRPTPAGPSKAAAVSTGTVSATRSRRSAPESRKHYYEFGGDDVCHDCDRQRTARRRASSYSRRTCRYERSTSGEEGWRYIFFLAV
jgi:hypothetical protein